jgi:hypothetical protein
MHYRIDAKNALGVWEPGAVVFDLRITPLEEVYGYAQQLACDNGCDTRVVVVTTIEWTTVEQVKVFSGVAEAAPES